MFETIMRKIVSWLDPKLARFRAPKPAAKPIKYTPKTLEDFIAVLQRTPRSILSTKDRDRIAAIMSFDARTVGHLMAPRSQMVFVSDKEVLGPLVLDKLYKSGFTNFPVTNSKGDIIGIIHTEALNALEIKKTDRATKYLDHTVHYLRTTDSLKSAVEEIERMSCHFFLVQDGSGQTVGCFTVQMLLDYLLN